MVWESYRLTPQKKLKKFWLHRHPSKFTYNHSCLWPHLQPWAPFHGPFVEGSFKKKAAKAAILERRNLDLARKILFPGGVGSKLNKVL